MVLFLLQYMITLCTERLMAQRQAKTIVIMVRMHLEQKFHLHVETF